MSLLTPTITEQKTQRSGGFVFHSMLLTIPSVTAADMVAVDVGAPIVTVTLFEAELVTPGTATTIQPEVYNAYDDDPEAVMKGNLPEQFAAASAADRHRLPDNARAVAPTNNTLWVRPKVDTGTATSIQVRMSWAEGHLP